MFLYKHLRYNVILFQLRDPVCLCDTVKRIYNRTLFRPLDGGKQQVGDL